VVGEGKLNIARSAMFFDALKKPKSLILLVIPHLMRDPGLVYEALDSRVRGNDIMGRVGGVRGDI